MAKITLLEGLPFVSVKVQYSTKEIVLSHVLIDSGSAATLFKTDAMLDIGIQLDLESKIRYIQGVGGLEPVIPSHVDAIFIDNMVASPFLIQMGALNYGFPFAFDGILGVDFLLHVQAVLDFERLEIRKT